MSPSARRHASRRTDMLFARRSSFGETEDTVP